MKLSVVIPVYNEAATVEKLITAVVHSPYENKEIIVVDDGSTDGTREILREKIETKVSRIIYQPRNRGKGAALRAGFFSFACAMRASASSRVTLSVSAPLGRVALTSPSVT